MSYIRKAFTLVEILVVIILAVILLAMTFNLWRDYINFLKFKQDREKYINLIDTAIVTARTTNYYQGTKYTYLDVTMDEDALSITYGTWNAASAGSCGTSLNEFDTHNLTNASVTWFSTPTTVRILPFEIWCFDIELGWTETCSTSTWLNVIIESTITDDETCYSFDLSTCKFVQVVCS